VFLAFNGQHVGGLFDAMLEAGVQPGILEDNVDDVECRAEVNVEAIVVRQLHVSISGWRDRQTTQPRNAVRLRAQQLLAAVTTRNVVAQQDGGNNTENISK